MAQNKVNMIQLFLIYYPSIITHFEYINKHDTHIPGKKEAFLSINNTKYIRQNDDSNNKV